MNDPLLEELIALNYVGMACVQCGHVVQCAEDLKQVRFGLMGDVVCKRCWDGYTKKLIFRFRDALVYFLRMYDSSTPPSNAQVRGIKRLIRYKD